MTKLTEHPLAALFPMMTKQELQELADDIAENGLQEPIRTTSDGKQLVDGRNRLAACKIAKIEPRFEALNGQDVEAFIISHNLARRHMTPGQRAMVVAMMYPDAQRGGPRKKGASSATELAFPMVHKTSLHNARKVFRVANDLVGNVLNGSLSLEKAYQEAKNREDLASSTETKMELLRDSARDLAELVKEERMDIDEALAAMKERERKEIEAIEDAKRAADIGLTRFLADVDSIIQGSKLIDDKFLDKKTVHKVYQAATKLQNLVS